MSYIIGNKCIDVCDTECVTACPVDAIHGPLHVGKSAEELAYLKSTGEINVLKDPQLYINPITCIDCNRCLPVCPVDAIDRNEREAILSDDEVSIHRNYSFYGEQYRG